MMILLCQKSKRMNPALASSIHHQSCCLDAVATSIRPTAYGPAVVGPESWKAARRLLGGVSRARPRCGKSHKEGGPMFIPSSCPAPVCGKAKPTEKYGLPAQTAYSERPRPHPTAGRLDTRRPSGARSRVFLRLPPTAAHITPGAATSIRFSVSLAPSPAPRQGIHPPAGRRLSCARPSIRQVSCSRAVFALHFTGSDPAFYVFLSVLPAGS
jgi:hypothetical protein